MHIPDLVPFSIVHVHILQPLPPDKAWQLFCRKAFGSEVDCPPELEKSSHDILEKCGGLPLAIVAVGGLLSTKRKVVSEWKKLLDGLGSKLGSDPHLKSCNRVLSESYYDLPQNLRPCLLYFGLFPESSSIGCDRLIGLWIAEGFAPYSKRPPTEQVAEEYLTELIDRSLVQVTGREISGRASTCRVHDLMREIILRKTMESGFCRFLNGEDVSDGSKTRRISIQRSTDNLLESIKDTKIRSILLFNVVQLLESLMTILVANFKLIKVLDFEDAPLDYLPDGVGKLFRIHYLSLKGTRVKKLPKSIGMLINLETLNLRFSLVSELPIEIKYLKKLSFLVARFPSGVNTPFKSGAKIHEGFGALTDLQRLRFVYAKSKAVKELGKLRKLKKLGVILRNRNVKYLFDMVHNMESLEYLGVESTSVQETLDIQSIASPPQSLQNFYLKANIKKLSDWIFKLENLLSVRLVSRCGSTDIPLSVFQALPNLLKLSLKGTCSDEELHFEEGCFPKLQQLQLFDFGQLKTIMIDKGSMPNLGTLRIGPCPLLKEIPTGIEHLRNLKTVQFFKMVKEAYYMIKSENWEKVTSHIPTILVAFFETDRRTFAYPVKYLRSLSPEDFHRLIQPQSQGIEQPHV